MRRVLKHSPQKHIKATISQQKSMNYKEHNCISIEVLLSTAKINIDRYGLQIILVSETDYLPSFGYSIGLWEKYKHPEIICFGLPTDLLHEIINDVAKLIKEENPIILNKPYNNIFQNSKAEFIKVNSQNIEDYFKVAIRHYNSKDFPAIQLIWTDHNDKLPWESGFENDFLYKQPLLDRNMDFKFREPKNLGIFTTRQWLEFNKPILRVVHDFEGDWQFLTGDQMSEDIKLVSLEQMILRDKTLNEVFDLEYGESAERDFIGGEWIRLQEIPKEEEE